MALLFFLAWVGLDYPWAAPLSLPQAAPPAPLALPQAAPPALPQAAPPALPQAAPLAFPQAGPLALPQAAPPSRLPVCLVRVAVAAFSGRTDATRCHVSGVS